MNGYDFLSGNTVIIFLLFVLVLELQDILKKLDALEKPKDLDEHDDKRLKNILNELIASNDQSNYWLTEIHKELREARDRNEHIAENVRNIIDELDKSNWWLTEIITELRSEKPETDEDLD